MEELIVLERQLNAARQTKPAWREPQPSDLKIHPHKTWTYPPKGDPNDTVETVPHPTPVRDKLRAAVADPNTTEQDRAAAKETLRISFREF
jgi:hypothetical protein